MASLPRREPALLVVALALSLAGGARAQDAEPVSPPTNGHGTVDGAAGDSPVERYRRGVASFDYGDCGAAVGALEAVAVPGILDDEKQLVDAYRILGVCYFQSGRTDDAVRFLEALLYIDPAYQLDPFRTPPPVSELFEERKALIQKKLEQIEEEKRRQAAVEVPGGLVIERERVLQRTPLATVFLPFGAAQQLNGEGTKGLIIGGLQGLLLAANLAATATALGVDMSDGKAGSAPYGDYVQRQVFTGAWAASVVAFTAFVGTYVYGVADAWWNRVPEEELSSTEKHRRVEGDEAKKLLRRLDDTK